MSSHTRSAEENQQCGVDALAERNYPEAAAFFKLAAALLPMVPEWMHTMAATMYAGNAYTNNMYVRSQFVRSDEERPEWFDEYLQVLNEMQDMVLHYVALDRKARDAYEVEAEPSGAEKATRGLLAAVNGLEERSTGASSSVQGAEPPGEPPFLYCDDTWKAEEIEQLCEE